MCQVCNKFTTNFVGFNHVPSERSDDVFFAVICDDQLFVKVTPEGEAAFPDLPKAPPYEGAKESFLVEDVEDRERLTALTRITGQALRSKQQKKGKR